MVAPPEAAPVRLAELVAALSLGIDLGFGQPMEHVLRQCRIALRLGELLGLDETERESIYRSRAGRAGVLVRAMGRQGLAGRPGR